MNRVKAMLALLIAACGLSVFGATGDAVSISNTSGTTAGGNVSFPSTETYKITIPASDSLISGTKVRVTMLKFGQNSDQNTCNIGYITINGITSDAMLTKGKSNLLSNNAIALRFGFGGPGAANECVLTVGTEYTLKLLTSSGTALTSAQDLYTTTYTDTDKSIVVQSETNVDTKRPCVELTGMVYDTPYVGVVPVKDEYWWSTLKENLTKDGTTKAWVDGSYLWLQPNGAATLWSNASYAGTTVVKAYNDSGDDSLTLKTGNGNLSITTGYFYIPVTILTDSITAFTLAEQGSLTYDATSSSLAISKAKDSIRTTTGQVTFKGSTSSSTGVTIDYGSSGNLNYTYSGHCIFDGGTHTFQNYSEGPSVNFGTGATVANPTFWIKNGATLNFKSHNPCGWSLTANADGIVRIGDQSKVKISNSGGGTWYWAQQFYFEPGSALEIATNDKSFRVNGGTTESTAQIYMPNSDSGSTAATISASGDGTFRLGANDHPGVAVSIGDNSTLEIAANVTSDGAQELKKYGAGTLKISGTMSGMTGKITVSKGKLAVTSAGAIAAPIWVEQNGALDIGGASDATMTAALSGAGSVIKTGAGKLALANTNSGFTGTITVSDGTLDIGTSRPTIVGTSTGTVAITLTDTETTNFNNGDAIISLPISGTTFTGTLVVYDNTGAEREIETPTISDSKISFTKKADSRIPPFTVTNATSGNWTSAGWKDSTSPTSADVVPDDWASKVSATITEGSGNTATLTLDRNVTIGTFTINNAGTLSIAGNGSTTIAVDTLDDSASTGATTIKDATGVVDVTAGVNTTLDGVTGSGTLTVAENKIATVASWDKSKVSGAGTVNISAAEASTPVTWGETANFTGTMCLKKGTWTVSAGGNSAGYPRKSAVVIDGSDATLAFTSAVDATGYNGTLDKSLTIKNGGTLRVDMRDTFSRALYLENGGQIKLPQDATQSYRAFDFYGSSSLTVSGTGNTIGGTTAGSTTGSGIVSLRNSPDNLVVTVNEAGQLDVYSQWGGYSGYNAWGKSGAGRIVFHRAAGDSMKATATVNAGTLQHVDGGEGTKGEIALVSGAKLELNATTADGSYTAANVISGAGSIEKLGAGTYTLTGTSTYTGGATISAGTLKIGNAAALGTGSATIAAGATLDVNGQTLTNAMMLNGGELKGAATSTDSGKITVSAASKIAAAADTTLTLSGTITGTAGITIGNTTDTGTVDLSGATMDDFSGAITLDGTVILPSSAAAPTATTIEGNQACLVSTTDTTKTYTSTTPAASITTGDTTLYYASVDLAIAARTAGGGTAVIKLLQNYEITVADEDVAKCEDKTYSEFQLANGITVTYKNSAGDTICTQTATTDGEAVKFAGSKYDENGLIPYNWYKFNGDSTSYGEQSISFGGTFDTFVQGAKGASEKEAGQAANYHCPYASNLSLGDGSWTISIISKLVKDESNDPYASGWWQADRDGIAAVGFGRIHDSYQDREGFALVKYGSSDNKKIAIKRWGNSDKSAYLVTPLSDVEDAFHVYTIINDTSDKDADGNPKISLAIDGVVMASQYVTLPDPGSYVQISSLYDFQDGYGGQFWANRYFIFDDFRVYHKVLSSTQLKTIAAAFNLRKNAAKIGETEYTTLQEAVNAASTESASTITMLNSSDETVTIDRDVIITEPGEQLATATINIAKGKKLTLTFDNSENRTFTVKGADTSSTLEINTTGNIGFDSTTSFRTLTLKINSVQGYGTWIDGVICDSSVDLDVETTLHIEKNAATVGNLTGTSTSASIQDTALTVNLTDNCTYAGSIGPALTVNGSGKTLTTTGSTVSGTVTLGPRAAIVLVPEKDVAPSEETYHIVKSGTESPYTYTSTMYAAKLGDDYYDTVQAAINASVAAGGTGTGVVIIDSTAEIPTGYVKATNTTTSVVTLHKVGDEVYWKSGDWTDNVVVYADGNHTSTLTYSDGDVMVFDTDETVVYPMRETGGTGGNLTHSVKIRVVDNVTVNVGHDGYNSDNARNIPDKSTITLGTGSAMIFRYWNTGTQGYAQLQSATINGANGTFGYDSSLTTYLTMGTITGTATLLVTNGESVTATSLENPVKMSGACTLTVTTSGTQPTSVTAATAGYIIVTSTSGDNTVYTCEATPETLPEGTTAVTTTPANSTVTYTGNDAPTVTIQIPHHDGESAAFDVTDCYTPTTNTTTSTITFALKTTGEDSVVPAGASMTSATNSAGTVTGVTVTPSNVKAGFYYKLVSSTSKDSGYSGGTYQQATANDAALNLTNDVDHGDANVIYYKVQLSETGSED